MANDLSSNITRGYVYGYDELNRITSADYATRTTGSYSLSSGYDMQIKAYDMNGNIKGLSRYGSISEGLIDDLSYQYEESGLSNLLRKVEDASLSAEGFKDGANTNEDYQYDENGNIKIDRNKSISDITYNHLNLPTSININGGNISYLYDARGLKLRKMSEGITTDYIENFIYKNGIVKFFSHSEGYVEPDGSGGYNYVYNYTDHLGNVRLTYADLNNNGTIDPSSEILDEKNYYPFGLEHQGYNTNVISENNFMTYQGQELEKELGKNTLAFQWRDYDPAIGRFNKIDRFAEKYSSHSPYGFTKNNPVRFVEVAGDSLWISFGKDNANRVLYQDGKLTNADGSRYEGAGVKVKRDGSVKITNSFLKSAVNALDEISQAEGEAGTNVVSTLQSSDNNFTIQSGGNRFGANQPGESPNINMNDATYYYGQIEGKAYVGGGAPSNTIGAGGTIFWNPSNRGSYITRNGTRSGNTSITLGHELFHAYDSNSGNLDGRILPGGTLRMEARAVYFGNQLRSTNTFGNRPLRYQYSPGSTVLAPQGNPFNIAPPSIEVLKN